MRTPLILLLAFVSLFAQAQFVTNFTDSHGNPQEGQLFVRFGGGNPDPWVYQVPTSTGHWEVTTDRDSVGIQLWLGQQIIQQGSVPTDVPFNVQSYNQKVIVTDESWPVEDLEIFYSSDGWVSAGFTDQNGVLNIEMLPTQFTLKVKYQRYPINRKTIQVSSNAIHSFNVAYLDVTLSDGHENPVNGAQVTYLQDNQWFNFGTTGDNGQGVTSGKLWQRQTTVRCLYNGSFQDQVSDGDMYFGYIPETWLPFQLNNFIPYPLLEYNWLSPIGVIRITKYPDGTFDKVK